MSGDMDKGCTMGGVTYGRGVWALAIAIATLLMFAATGRAAASDGVKVERAGGSSSVRFLRIAPRGEAAAAGSAGSISHRARTLTRSLRPELGLGGSDDFEVIGVERAGLAGPAVRLQQLYRGVPVLGAQVIARADGARQQFRSVSGETRPVSVDVDPSVSESAASSTAVAAATKQEAVPEAGLRPGQGTLQVYDPHIHSFGFEGGPENGFDGGLVVYSTDGGKTWLPLPQKWFTDNGYNGALNVTHGNPLAGQAVFAGRSDGYGASRANLSKLAGKRVRIGFEVGTDSSVASTLWALDNVRIYSCGRG